MVKEYRSHQKRFGVRQRSGQTRAHLALVDAYCNTMLACVVRRRDDDCGGGGQVQYGRRSNGDEQDDGRPRHPRHWRPRSIRRGGSGHGRRCLLVDGWPAGYAHGSSELRSSSSLLATRPAAKIYCIYIDWALIYMYICKTGFMNVKWISTLECLDSRANDNNARWSKCPSWHTPLSSQFSSSDDDEGAAHAMRPAVCVYISSASAAKAVDDVKQSPSFDFFLNGQTSVSTFKKSRFLKLNKDRFLLFYHSCKSTNIIALGILSVFRVSFFLYT